ncbi:hypothetical protein [Bradyrhizobium sp. CSA207]|nr:hypothetical protein [Bradyrhizobium sp. CSA207]
MGDKGAETDGCIVEPPDVGRDVAIALRIAAETSLDRDSVQLDEA